VKNQLPRAGHGAKGVCRKKKLFTAKRAQGTGRLGAGAVGPVTGGKSLLRMFDELAAATTQLDAAVEQAAKNSAAGGAADDASREWDR